MKKHTAYKVFSYLKNGTLRSAGNIPDYAKFNYSRTKVNFPKIKHSKFLCFNTLKRAKEFYSIIKLIRPTKLQIWEIETDSLTSYGKLPRVWNNAFKNMDAKEALQILMNFWDGKLLKTNAFIGLCVSGVKGTDNIKLIKRVY